MYAAAVHLMTTAASRSDRELVTEFLTSRDEATFAELVKRHSAMVRRVASDVVPDAADDIAQATFALFQKKIAAVADRDSAAGWLCQTSRRLALKARTATLRRRVRETKSANEKVVVEESNALPDQFRLP